MKARGRVTFRPGGNVTREEAIRREVRPNTAAYARYLTLLEDMPPATAPGALRRAHWRKVRKCVVEVLEDHLSRGFGGRGVATLPDDVAMLLRDSLRAVSDGADHPLLDARTPKDGGRYPGRGNRRTVQKADQIMWGVAYITLADLGMIRDGSARLRVQRRYGVSERQVYRWLGECGGKAEREQVVHDFLVRHAVHGNSDSKGRVARKLMLSSGRSYRDAR